MLVAVATPKLGVASVGLPSKTTLPVPVLSVPSAVARFAPENVPSSVATPVPKPAMPVDRGSPVQLVRTPEAGVPRAGPTSTGPVANTSCPVPVSSLMTPRSWAEVVAANWLSGSVVRASPPPPPPDPYFTNFRPSNSSVCPAFSVTTRTVALVVPS